MNSTRAEIEEAENSQRHPFPTELSLWTVDDVCRWLDTLQLGEYKQAFREGKVRVKEIIMLMNISLQGGRGEDALEYCQPLFSASRAGEVSHGQAVRIECIGSRVQNGRLHLIFAPRCQGHATFPQHPFITPATSTAHEPSIVRSQRAE